MEKTKKEIVEAGKTGLYEDDMIYGIKAPRTSCRYCNGTGKEGWDQKGEPVLCRCLSRTGEGEWITAAAFKSICENKRYEVERSTDDVQSDQVHTSENTAESQEEEA